MERRTAGSCCRFTESCCMSSWQSPPPIILLAGPTAAGKTQLAIDLALHLGTEIVNCDSMQVYRYMEIGTAKPTREERARVAHHLLDVADPDEAFDAARYAELARPVVETLRNRGKTAAGRRRNGPLHESSDTGDLFRCAQRSGRARRAPPGTGAARPAQAPRGTAARSILRREGASIPMTASAFSGPWKSIA